MKIDLGCGLHPLEGFVGVDILSQSDYVIDLEQAQLPFEDASVDEIWASHVMEHIHNLIPLMNECHRVLKVGGIFTILVPLYPHKQAIQDPTHVRYFVEDTFLYWNKDAWLYENVGKTYGILPFKLVRAGYRSGKWEFLVEFTKEGD